MKKYLILSALFFHAILSFAQSGELEIKGTVNDDSTGAALSDVIVFIKEFNGDTIESVRTTTNGKYKLSKVPASKNYKIFFTKKDFISKYCVIETDKIDPKDSTDLPIEISISLFKGDIADYSFLQFAPVAIAIYDKSIDNLFWDIEYIQKMKELMDKIKNKK